MNHFYRLSGLFLTIGSLIFSFSTSNAQILTEDFEGVTPPAIPGTWSTSGNNTSDFWKTGDSTAANGDGFFPVPAHTNFAWTNDAVCNCDKADDYLEMPSLDLTGLVGYELKFEAYHDGTYTGALTVEVSVDNGLSWFGIHTVDTNVSSWTSHTVDLSVYDGLSNVKLRFHYDDLTNWASGVAVDDIVVDQSPPDVGAVAVVAPTTFCEMSANEQVTVMVVNFGTSPQANIPVSYTLDGGAPVMDTITSTLSPGDSIAFTFSTTVDLSAAGTFSFDAWTSQVGDVDNSNDSLFNHIVYTSMVQQGVCIFDTDSNGGADTTCGSFSGDLGVDGYVYGDTAMKSSDPFMLGNDSLHSITFNLYMIDCTGGDTVNYSFYLNGMLIGTYLDTSADCTFTPAVYPTVVEITDAAAIDAAFIPGMNTLSVKNDGGALHYVSGFTADVFGECIVLAVGILNSTNVLCNGDATGSATVESVTGTPPLTYLWDDSGTQTTMTATGLVAGTYTVYVSDSLGYTDTAMVTITQPNAISSSVNVTDVLCKGGATGAVDVTTIGGNTPYTFAWSSSETSEDISNVIIGTYTLLITDGNGCTHNDTAMVNEPLVALSSSSVVTEPLCNGGADGMVDITPAGGTTPYTFMWSNSETTEDLASLSTATYSVTVTDSNGCTFSEAVVVGEPAMLLLSGSSTPEMGTNSDGTATITASGGTGAYTYMWSNAQTTSTATGLSTNTYFVTVTDNNNCSQMDSVSVGTVPGVAESTVDAGLSVYPNPSNGNASVSYTLAHTANVTLAVYNIIGVQTNLLVDEQQKAGVYTYNLSIQDDKVVGSAGVYIIKLSMNNKVYIERLVDIR